MRTQTPRPLRALLLQCFCVPPQPARLHVGRQEASGYLIVSHYPPFSALSLSAVHTSGFLSGWETTLDSKQFTPQPGPPEEGPACALKEEDGASAAAARPSTSAEALQAAAPGVWDAALKPDRKSTRPEHQSR